MGCATMLKIWLLSWLMMLTGQESMQQSGYMKTNLETISSNAISAAHNGQVCSTWGNFHYSTFDGDFFQLPYSCNYILATLCDKTQSDFNIQMKREYIENIPTISSFTIKLEGIAVMLYQGNITMNNILLNVPAYSNGIRIEKITNYIKISSKTVTVIWDEDNSLSIEISTKYRNQTCGLCGDFNGILKNEFIENGQQLLPEDFGIKWKMDSPTEICEQSKKMPQEDLCNKENDICEKLLYNSTFESCHTLLPTNVYLETCQKDLCQCNSNEHVCICDTVSEFSRQCAHAGGSPKSWRSQTLCEIRCPANMVYSECGSPCVDTCSNQEGTQLCEDHCMDGCVCPPGTVIDDVTKTLRCISVDECPCNHNGQIYQPGESFEKACQKCICLKGMWNCNNLDCPGTCSLLGGSHVITYDNKAYSFDGNCDYILSKDNTSDVTVLVNLVQCGQSAKETCLNSVKLIVSKFSVTVMSSGNILINEVATKLPHFTDYVKIFAPSTFFIIAQTPSLQIVIQLIPTMQVYSKASSELKGTLSGLCGNFNDMQVDDFKTESGLIEGTATTFASTWKSKLCQDFSTSPYDPCSMSVEKEKYAKEWCEMLRKEPFSRCHIELNPKDYVERCMYDACNCAQSEDCMCAAVSSYVHACADRGVILERWRDNMCSIFTSKCPGNMVYSYNQTSCSKTCRSLGEKDYTCSLSYTPVDGCGCPENTFLNDLNDCVPSSQCPCYINGDVVAPNQVIRKTGATCNCRDGTIHCIGNENVIDCKAPMVYFDCSEAEPGQKGTECQKSCHTTYSKQCTNTQCNSGCVCPDGLLDDGQGGCVTEQNCPCVHNGNFYPPGQTIKADCNKCTCHNRKWMCTEEECHKICTIYGDSHYISFDGRRYTFNGNCEYTLVQDYCRNSSIGSFRIITENIPCGTTGTTCSKSIKMFLGNKQLLLSEENIKSVTQENGPEISYKLHSVGIYLVIEVENNLTLIWDKKTSLMIKLGPSFKGNVCGLCGNYDGDQNNDFMTRTGEEVAIPNDFGNSWRVSTTCPLTHSILGPCDALPYRQAWAMKQCSILKSDVFSTCFSVVDPAPYYDACVTDTCACNAGGDCECFCTAVAAYAAACRGVGVCISWRSPSICPLFCDYYNTHESCEWHYNPCGQSCMKTCTNPAGRCYNAIPPLEGCFPQCPSDRPYLDEATMKCVAKEKCGCYDENNKHYSVGDMIPTTTNCMICYCTTEGPSCQYSPEECYCEYEGLRYKPGDTIYNKRYSNGICITARCGQNGTIDEQMTPCSTTPFTSYTTTTQTISTPTVETSSTTTQTSVSSTTLSTPTTSVTETTVSLTTPTTTITTISPPTTTGTISTPTVETSSTTTQTSVSSTTLSTLTTSVTETTSTVSPTTTTTGCQPCYWSEWLNNGYPESTENGKDIESIYEFWKSGNISCEKPEGIECRAVEYKDMPLSDLGQNVTCDTTDGLICNNIDQSGEHCFDYEIRVKCCDGTPCSSTSIQTSTTLSSTTSSGTSVVSSTTVTTPTTSITETTASSTIPSTTITTVITPTTTETISTPTVETSSTTTQTSVSSTTLSTPTTSVTETTVSSTTPTTTITTISPPTTTGTISTPTVETSSTTTQTSVSSTTLSTLTTSVTETTSTVSPTTTTTGCQPCYWSEWLNNGYPESTENGKDIESIYEFWKSGNISCEKPEGIECRAVEYKDMPLSDLGQNVTCDTTDGLICNNIDQSGEHCFDYEIRVKCCDGTPCSSTSIQTSTTLSSTTSSGTSVVSSTTVTTPTTSITETTASSTIPSTTITTVITPTTTETISTPTVETSSTTTQTSVSSTTLSTPTTSVTETTVSSTTPTTTITTISPPTTTETISTPTVETSSTTTQTSVSSTTLSTLTTSVTETTSTVSPTTTTTGCQPCYWSEWLNNGYPESTENGKDIESIYEFWKSGNISCEKPEGIECRAVEYKDMPLSDLGQNVTCDTTDGLICNNIDQSGEHCFDYEIRVKCCDGTPCSSTSIQTSTTLSSTTSSGTSVVSSTTVTTPTTSITETTASSTIPSTTITTVITPTTTETISTPTVETSSTTTQTSVSSTTLSTPTTSVTETTVSSTTPTTTITTISPPTTTETISTPTVETSSTTTQTSVSSTTLSTLTTSVTETTSTVSPTTTTTGCQPCYWSEWLNNGYPESTENGKDIESIYEFWKSGNISCEKPEGIECRAVEYKDMPLSDLGQNVTCDTTDGLICNNIDQSGEHCFDYEIRVKCCDGTPCSSTSIQTSTTLSSTTSSGTSVVSSTTVTTPTTSITETTASSTIPSTTITTVITPTTTETISTPTVETSSTTTQTSVSSTTLSTPTTSVTETTVSSTTPTTTITTISPPTTTETISTPTVETSSTTTQTSVSSTTLSTLTTSVTETTSTVSPTTTTTGCQPCYWSEWLNNGYPESTENGKDIESIYEFWKSGNISCEKPEGIECRAVEYKDMPLSDLGQNVTCDTTDGLICNNIDQSGEHCFDYEIRVKCCDGTPCSSTSIQTSTTLSSTTSSGTSVVSSTTVTTPTTSITETTASSTIPSTTITTVITPTTTETISTPTVETSSTTTQTSVSSTTLSTPTTSVTETTVSSTTPTTTITTISPPTTTETISTPTVETSSTTTQTSVSSTTLSTLTTSVTETTSTVSPTTTTTGCQPCYWSEWLNNGYPESTENGKDIESIYEFWKSGNISCEKPEGIECRAVEYKDMPLSDLGQNVTCDTTDGLICNNIDQSGEHCFDYEIRVKCCDGTPCSSTSIQTSTTLSSTTSSGTSVVSSTTVTTPTTSITETTASSTIPSTTITTVITPTTTETISTPTVETSSTTTQTSVSSTTLSTPTTSVTETTVSSTTPTTTITTISPPTTTETISTPTVETSSTTTQTSVSSTTLSTLTTSVTETTSTVSPTTTTTGCQPCYWSEWLNNGYPESTENGKDIESIYEFWKSGNISCEKPEGIECRAVEYKDMPLSDLGQNVTCDTTDGLICNNIDQSGEHCFDYEIRVKCCDGTPCSSTSIQTSTTLSSTTSSGTSVVSSTTVTTPTTSITETTASSTIPSTTITTVITPTTTETISTPTVETSSTTTQTSVSSTTLSTPTTSVTETTVSSTTPTTTITTISPPTTTETISTEFSVITMSHPTVKTEKVNCSCSYQNKTYDEGSVIYNKTDGTGWCHIAYCNSSCTITEKSEACKISTPTTTASITTSPSLRNCSYLNPPRKNGESWKENCYDKTCKDGSVTLTPVQCLTSNPNIPVCVNGLPPEKVYDETGCCYQYACQCRCNGWGDPHYVTFDGQYYAFQGNCTYVLVQEIIKKYNLSIHIKNYMCDIVKGLACPEYLTIYYQSYIIDLKQTRNPTVNKVFVNNKLQTPFYSNVDFTITTTGIAMTLDIPAIKVQVTFKGMNFAVRLPFSLFYNNTEGQCGKCDNNISNDCSLPNGTIKPCEEMAPEWSVNNTNCTTTPPLPPKPCNPPICEIILNDVFKECHKVLNATNFYKACVYDVCHMNITSQGCASLEQFAQMCAEHSRCVDWRNLTNGTCAHNCPTHKVYMPCGPKVEETCNSKYNEKYVNCTSQVCTDNFREGCFCPNGTTLVDPVSDVCTYFCGCIGPDGQPKRPGDKWRSQCRDCTCSQYAMGPVCIPVECQTPTHCTKAGYELQIVDCCQQCVCNTSLCPTTTENCPVGFELVQNKTDSCCTSFDCHPKHVCVFGINMYLPGDKVLTGSCEDCVCGSTVNTSTNLLNIKCTAMECTTMCPVGFSYENVPGQCCGQCVQKQCVYKSEHLPSTVTTVEVGESWTHPNETCATFNCTKVNNVFVLVKIPRSCPEYNPEDCIPGTEKSTSDGCCNTCQLYNCRMLKNITYLKVNECISINPVEVASCSGTCNTGSIYSTEANTMMHSCSCCQERQTSIKAVQLRCADNSLIPYTYTYTEECGCYIKNCTDSKKSK